MDDALPQVQVLDRARAREAMSPWMRSPLGMGSYVFGMSDDRLKTAIDRWERAIVWYAGYGWNTDSLTRAIAVARHEFARR